MLFPIVATRSVAKPVKDLLVAPHHPEFLARDPFLRRAVALHQLEVPSERIDLPLQRIHLTRERPRPEMQDIEVPGAVFPALHREKERHGDENPPHIPLHRIKPVASWGYSSP